MKKMFLLLMAATTVFVINAQNKIDQEPFITKTFNEAIRNVEVKTSGGNISIAGTDGAGGRVEVYVRANNGRDINISQEEIKRRMSEDYDLTLSVNNNKLTALAKPKERNRDWKKGLSISFKIVVARNVTTDLATSGGSISLSDLNGTNEFATSGGSLNVNTLSGKIKGRTSGGSINVSNSKDEIDLATSGGSINAEKCTGNIMLTTSGGSLNLRGLNGIIKASTSGGTVRGEDIDGALEAHTSGGSISLKDLSCSLETSTSGGNIDVSIKDLSKFVKIQNSGGHIDLQIPRNKGINLKIKGDRVSTGELRNFDGTIEKDRIDGKMNGGGIPVNVSAGSGRVSLSFN